MSMFDMISVSPGVRLPQVPSQIGCNNPIVNTFIGACAQ